MGTRSGPRNEHPKRTSRDDTSGFLIREADSFTRSVAENLIDCRKQAKESREGEKRKKKEKEGRKEEKKEGEKKTEGGVFMSAGANKSD